MSLLLQMSSASASVGKVLYTFGVVTVETPAVQKLEKGSVLDAGHIIVQPAPKGYAQLLLEDGTKIAIRPALTVCH